MPDEHADSSKRLLVVCDTNQLFGNPFRQIAPLQSMAANQHVRLAFPEVVVRELVAQRRDALERIDAHFEHDRQRLESSVSGSLYPARSGADPTVEQRVAEYERRLRNDLHRKEIEVLPLPDGSIERARNRAVKARRPFTTGGMAISGLRDALVWDSVLAVARSSPDETVVLLSSDGDFAAEKQAKDATTREFHRDLLSDLHRDGLHERVLLVRSVAKLLVLLPPSIAAVAGLHDVIQANRLAFEERILEAVAAFLNDSDAPGDIAASREVRRLEATQPVGPEANGKGADSRVYVTATVRIRFKQPDWDRGLGFELDVLATAPAENATAADLEFEKISIIEPTAYRFRFNDAQRDAWSEFDKKLDALSQWVFLLPDMAGSAWGDEKASSDDEESDGAPPDDDPSPAE